jgi:hypothetical protein
MGIGINAGKTGTFLSEKGILIVIEVTSMPLHASLNCLVMSG